MKRAIPILFVILALAGAGTYWWTRDGDRMINFSPNQAINRIVGSGSIEAEIVAITTELGGRIVAMYADEGDEVKEGDLLVELDTSLLEARRQQLEANLANAQANLAEVSAPPRAEDVAAAQAELQQAQAARNGALAVWQEARSLADNPLELSVEVESARTQVAVVQKDMEAAQAELKEAQIKRDEQARNQSNHEALVSIQVAEQRVQAAEANLHAAEAELDGARLQLALLIDLRDNPLALIAQANAAETAYQQAEAAGLLAETNLNLVKAGSMPEEVAIAEAKVKQAEAAMVRVQVQLDKMRLTSPRDGLITNRAADPGELATPGDILLNVGDLDEVKLKVYIPETQTGQVKVGQVALVDVDAYPDRTFQGCVTFIASEAEFTPRNVQTKEERVNLVFAVEITLDNPTHELKPGMPADAEILPDTSGCSLP
jgi:multidrug resistance efflux pump